MDMAARAQVARKEERCGFTWAEMRVQGATLQAKQGDRASLVPSRKEGGGGA